MYAKNMPSQFLTIEAFRAALKNPIVIVLDNIRSLNNVGSFFRTADSFLLEGILLCGITGCPPHREIEKTALGATLSVQWQYFQYVQEALQYLKDNGYKILAIEQSNKSVYLQDLYLNKEDKVALIFGNEVTGISQEALYNSDIIVEVPQMGTKHSLNVAVCGGIVCWEILKKLGRV